MNSDVIKKAAQRLLTGEITAQQLLRLLDQGRAAQLSSATVDLDRATRCGFPEVIYAAGKTVPQLTEIVDQLIMAQQPVLVTRLAEDQVSALVARYPSAIQNRVGRTLRIPSTDTNGKPDCLGEVAVVTAGTSDLPVSEEARETLLWMRVNTFSICDVGVAGPHRLLQHVDTLRQCDAVVVVAGMEGALPSVVGGHVPCPVIAVPTSVGYGASLGGIAALLSMLNSCAANVTVVNIDAGFKAGYVAGLIARNKHAQV